MTTNLPDPETMYAASVARDASFEGVFFMAVKTTGIFCRPTCHARNPKRENVEFFGTATEALAHGYRPCRVCNPMEPYGSAPVWVQRALELVSDDPGHAPTDQALRDLGVDPARLRRWFSHNHGMTFRAYLRMLRINEAYGNIRQGERVTAAAFRNGFGSVSGFGSAFKRTTGFAPAESAGQSIVTVTRILTPLGPMVAAATDEEICLLEFADRRMLERQLEIVQRRFAAPAITGAHHLLDQLTHELEEYFAGERRTFSIRLALRGTPFQEAAWQALREIPYGETRSYAEQARRAGRPTAIRAIGRANGDNRIAIVVPCHRVVGADGNLTGYGGGLWRKRFLLDLERQNVTAV